jgi:hypothetical protein
MAIARLGGKTNRANSQLPWMRAAVDHNGGKSFRTNQPVKGAPSARREAVSPLTG